jgi:hypothetical protein
MTRDVELLKGLALRNPMGSPPFPSWLRIQAILKLEEEEATLLSQYAVRVV